MTKPKKFLKGEIWVEEKNSGCHEVYIWVDIEGDTEKVCGKGEPPEPGAKLVFTGTDYDEFMVEVEKVFEKYKEKK